MTIAALILWVLNGCGAGPVFTLRTDPYPFPSQEIRAIAIGKTDYDTLIKVFGQPSIVRQDGRLLVFARSANLLGKVVINSVTESPFSHHYLVVLLGEHGLVDKFEVLRDTNKPANPCTSWGVCLWLSPWEYKQYNPYGIGEDVMPKDRDIAVLIDSMVENNYDKKSIPDEGQCAVYLYNSNKLDESWRTPGVYFGEIPFFWCNEIRFSVNDSDWRSLPKGMYQYRTTQPGKQQILASFGRGGDENEVKKYEFECKAERSYFIGLGLKENLFSTELKFVRESEDIAGAKIKAYYKILN